MFKEESNANEVIIDTQFLELRNRFNDLMLEIQKPNDLEDDSSEELVDLNKIRHDIMLNSTKLDEMAKLCEMKEMSKSTSNLVTKVTDVFKKLGTKTKK